MRFVRPYLIQYSGVLTPMTSIFKERAYNCVLGNFSLTWREPLTPEELQDMQDGLAIIMRGIVRRNPAPPSTEGERT